MLLSVQLCVLLCRYGVVLTTFVDFLAIDMIITYIRTCGMAALILVSVSILRHYQHEIF